MVNNDIIVDKADFNINHTLECGQLFRYYELNNAYKVRALDKECVLYDNGSHIVIENEDKKFFTDYFDLDTDYSAIKSALSEKPYMKDAIEYGYGIRILRQDPIETIISFIISANNHIPRIKGIIERICDDGAFPSLKSLAERSQDYYTAMGAGYRAEYLKSTCTALYNGSFDYEKVKNMPSDEANKYLCTLMGVGPKVADCILLFGYHKMDTFPVDTWIKKVYAEHFGESKNNKLIRQKLIETYGDLSGYAQQYLFYHKRELSR